MNTRRGVAVPEEREAMNTRRGAVNTHTRASPAVTEEREVSLAPTVQHELQLLKLQLEAEKEKARLMDETIAMLKHDKDYLQEELKRKDEFVRDLMKGTKNLLDAPSSSGESSKVRSDLKRVSDTEFGSFLDSESSLSDSSLEEVGKKTKGSKKRKNVPWMSTEHRSTRPAPESNRVRVKNSKGILKRYKAALEAFKQGKSMKGAFEAVGVDRNTICRTAPIAELRLAAPDAFRAIGQWNDKSEKLSSFIDRCRSAMTSDIKIKINEMKASGELLPISN